MPIVVTEKIESRRLLASRDGKASTFDLSLNVHGTMDGTAAKNAASAFAPEVWGSGYPQLWKQTVLVTCIGQELWEAVVHYDTSGPEPLQAESSFEFDIGGGTAHITQAIATVPFPPTLPDHRGAIGVKEDGDSLDVQGADIFAPEMTFGETHLVADLAPAYKRVLFEMRGRVNDAPFKGWNAGEVLFEGVNARRQDSRFQTPWSISFRFRVQPNAIVTVGDVSGIVKPGWSLLDIRYEEESGASSLLKRPVGAYVHQVYQAGDFSLLGIGV